MQNSTTHAQNAHTAYFEMLDMFNVHAYVRLACGLANTDCPRSQEGVHHWSPKGFAHFQPVRAVWCADTQRMR